MQIVNLWTVIYAKNSHLPQLGATTLMMKSQNIEVLDFNGCKSLHSVNSVVCNSFIVDKLNLSYHSLFIVKCLLCGGLKVILENTSVLLLPKLMHALQTSTLRLQYKCRVVRDTNNFFIPLTVVQGTANIAQKY